jgi:cyclase
MRRSFLYNKHWRSFKILAKRIIPCLDILDGKVVKGVNFQNLTLSGDPVKLAKAYEAQGADELVFLDITASYEKRAILKKVVTSVADAIAIPFTVGGGIRSRKDMEEVLLAGADKIAINTSAVENSALINIGAERYGRQCIVISIDAKKQPKKLCKKGINNSTKTNSSWEVYTHGGRTAAGIDALSWAKEAEKRGAGEILLTSIDCDGTNTGYDLELTRRISEKSSVPIIASGGAGKPEDILEVLTRGKADAALAASIFHKNQYTIYEVKKVLHENNIPVRLR